MTLQKIINFYNEDAYCWTVDPIDGTTNFANGRDKFAIMIALTFKERLKVFKNIFKEVNSYRCIGFEYIDIGIGIRNFAILSKLSPWDHIPGILFVREAGGADIDFDKNKYDFTKKNKNLIVSNSEDLNFKILEKLGEYL